MPRLRSFSDPSTSQPQAEPVTNASKWWLASRRGAGGASATVGLLALIIAAACESYGIRVSDAWSLEAAGLVLAVGGGAVHAWGKRRAKKTLRLRRKGPKA